jgi:hypothetical protein
MSDTDIKSYIYPGSEPRPDTTKATPYQPTVRPQVEQEIANSRRLRNIENSLDHLRFRANLHDAVLVALLKEVSYEGASDLLAWFEEHRVTLQRISKETEDRDR